MSRCNQMVCQVLWVWVAISSLMVCMTVPVHAGNMLTGSGNERIHISSDVLMVDSEAKFAEFKGNVRATQGKTVITAGTLRIFYQQTSGPKGKSADTGDAIEKIVAEDHVSIRFDDKVAEADQAVYTTKSRMLVLSGSDSKITSQNDFISGSKITFYRDNGRIKVEGSSKKPVEAIFYPGEKGID